ncbi:phosphate regulon sensor histidine kinase PhoR [Hoeflea prorocentri]|uniref:histidine kinase n=1 Tax=Hoeflea prorocentri TaxID=1922333 RepID=A0A9X3UL08_9HYPH|nr:phosphate regulon sensor histidine kinase PhoR [Hoeflea prorocentri]MCY6382584.1 phosphate regulon sensor histidine kinase PhoR [Hoeflea prorocentri]MDA5400384.1 phosphate regulon sensor histidine kinase PhoR [Hoeflea prorocentri]
MQELTHRVVQRLYDARYILVVAAVLSLLASLSREVPLWHALLGLALVFAAAGLPVQSRVARRQERMLRKERREPLEAIVFNTCEAMDDPAIILAPGGVIKFLNSAAVKQFGAMKEGAHLSSMLRSPAILDMVRTVMETGHADSIEHIEKVPSERWFLVRVAPMTGIAGMKGGSELYMLTFRDQSESRRMDRMRSDFIANASHELRTPLASLFGFIETMRGPAREDAEARDRFLGIMHEQASRMTRLVDDLLSLSRLELKAHVMPTDNVDLVPLINHISDSLKPLAEELGVGIQISAPDQPVVVTGDRDELVQVFENLIENACKYGQSGGQVRVSVMPSGENDGDGVEVSVSDNGPGIPREHVPRLTERFYRVNVEASRSKKGTGLGLAIVKHILTRHRARLIVHSTVGKGSDFRVKFGAPQR